MMHRKLIQEAVEDLILIGVVILAVFLLNRYVVINAKIPSASMENTVMTNDRIFGNRLAYRSTDPARYDIVIFKYPDDPTGETLFIKRIIGLPGETVSIRSGRVYLNGGSEPLDDSFCPEEPYGDFGPYEVPENCYFLLGDNRNDSHDSRFWEHTYLNKEDILGKAFFRYWPLKSFGKVN